MEIEKASHEDMKEEVHVQTGEAAWENSGYGSLHQLPPSKLLCSTNAQDHDCQYAEYSPDVIAENIPLLPSWYCAMDAESSMVRGGMQSTCPWATYSSSRCIVECT